MKVAIDGTAADDAVIVMTHVFAAPRALVWAAFTEPKHVVRWYGGRGFSNPICEMDVRPGGLWRHVMRTPDGAEHPLEFEFVEVSAPSKLSWRAPARARRKARDGGHPTPLSTLTLEELGARSTKVHFVARFENVVERDFAMSFGFADVLGEGVERMAEVLADLGRGGSAS